MKRPGGALLLVIFLLPLAHAAQPEEAKVGFYLLDVSKYDIRTGEFTADFYLDLRCGEGCEPGNFEFMNGRATEMELVINRSDEKFYRIRGTFVSPVDIEKYPFDRQTLSIVMEDKVKTTGELVYAPVMNESGIDDSITFPGWAVTGWSADVGKHDYPVYNETFSRYEFSMGIERMRLNALLKTFVPLFFIIIIALASLFLTPAEMGFRITIGSSTLITTVLLHLSLLSEIPATPYLTFTDKFMFLTYGVVLLCFLVNIAILWLNERKRQADVERLQQLTEKAVLLVPAVYALLFYLMLY